MKYVPALRYESLTRFYDSILRRTLKEQHFKNLLINQAQIRSGYRVLDVGCGTGTLAILLKRRHPEAEIVGIDADPKVLAIAEEKIRNAGLDIQLHEGLASEAPFEARSFDRVVSSLVFHHLAKAEKLRTLQRVRELLRPGGMLHVADWGKAQNPLMRAAFLSIQLLDGFEVTTDNVAGHLPRLMTDAGFRTAEETHHEMTIFGTLSLYQAVAE